MRINPSWVFVTLGKRRLVNMQTHYFVPSIMIWTNSFFFKWQNNRSFVVREPVGTLVCSMDLCPTLNLLFHPLYWGLGSSFFLQRSTKQCMEPCLPQGGKEDKVVFCLFVCSNILLFSTVLFSFFFLFAAPSEFSCHTIWTSGGWLQPFGIFLWLLKSFLVVTLLCKFYLFVS